MRRGDFTARSPEGAASRRPYGRKGNGNGKGKGKGKGSGECKSNENGKDNGNGNNNGDGNCNGKCRSLTAFGMTAFAWRTAEEGRSLGWGRLLGGPGIRGEVYSDGCIAKEPAGTPALLGRGFALLSCFFFAAGGLGGL